MKKGLLTTALIGICSLSANATFAENVDSSAIMSPNCSAEQIKEIAGDALISISKNQAWDDEVKGFIVSLDTNKLTYGDLAKKMMAAKCFDKPEG